MVVRFGQCSEAQSFAKTRITKPNKFDFFLLTAIHNWGRNLNALKCQIELEQLVCDMLVEPIILTN